MGSGIYIADGRRMSNAAINLLKEEKGFDLGPYRKRLLDLLYRIGERHSVPELPSDLRQDQIDKLMDSPDYPSKFSMEISEELFGMLGDDVPLHLTGEPDDIATIGDLRKQMEERGIKTEYCCSVDI